MFECFSMHFSEIGPKLAAKQNEATKAYFDYLHQAQTGFEISEINLQNVLHFLLNLQGHGFR